MTMTLQEQMVLYRAKERITQAELAKRCGLSRITIGCIENGTQNPTQKTRMQILLVIGGTSSDIEHNKN